MHTDVFRQAAIVTATAVSYYLLFQLNDYFFSLLHYSYGVMWIYLPSGLRLAAVLILGGWGAFGIALASIVIGFQSDPAGDSVTFIGAGIVSGLSALVALWICQDKFKLHVELANLSASTLLKMAAIFAVISPLLHQAWYSLRGHTHDFISSVLVMALGDLLGTILMLYIVKLLLSRLPIGVLSK